MDMLHEARPDIIGGTIAVDADGFFTQTMSFRTEADARAGEQKEPPPEVMKEMEQMDAMMSDVSYHDLHHPWFATRRRTLSGERRASPVPARGVGHRCASACRASGSRGRLTTPPWGRMGDMTSDEQQAPGRPDPQSPDDARVVVVMPGGMGVSSSDATRPADERAAGASREQEPTNPADLVEEPAKVMRIGSMIKQLLEEVRNAPLDDAGRRRLAEVHHRSLEELKDGLAPELVAELDRIALPFGDDSPSDAELRIAQAQLVGWLEGLFHGIQTALVAQQMAAQQQLQQMRALPAGPGASYGTPPGVRRDADDQGGQAGGPTGQYL